MPRPVRLGQNQGAVLKASSDHTKSSLCPGRALALRNLLLTYSLRAPSELGLPVWGGSRPCPATQGCTVVSSVAAGSQVLRAARAQSAACSGRLSMAAGSWVLRAAHAQSAACSGRLSVAAGSRVLRAARAQSAACSGRLSMAAGSRALRAACAQSAACSGRLSWAGLFPGGLVHRSRNNADMGQTRVVFVLGSLVHAIVRGRRDSLV